MIEWQTSLFFMKWMIELYELFPYLQFKATNGMIE
ncbi:hypothetical protein ACUXIS_001063 [Cytobacillus horneckiae]